MKILYSTLMLVLSAVYVEQSRNCVRVALDARRENEPTGFWLARARHMADQALQYRHQWQRWTSTAASA